MILLDTNVISEPLRPSPGARVIESLDAQAVETPYLAAITVAELRFGLLALPAGKRCKRLHERLERQVLPLFCGRVAPFDLPASQAYTDLMARARARGRPISQADGYIAAIASSRGFVVATRDTGPFRVSGVDIVNPWDAAS